MSGQFFGAVFSLFPWMEGQRDPPELLCSGVRAKGWGASEGGGLQEGGEKC